MGFHDQPGMDDRYGDDPDSDMYQPSGAGYASADRSFGCLLMGIGLLLAGTLFLLAAAVMAYWLIR